MVDLREKEYPYYKYFITYEKVLENFEDLKKYNYDYIVNSKKDIDKILKTPPKKQNAIYNYIKKNKDSLLYMLNIDLMRDQRFYKITDYFSEECRVECNFANYISPLEYYRLNKETVLENIKDVEDYDKIDDYMYFHGPKMFCSNFHLVVCTSVLKYFKPKRWLDPSAGWGDRLISAINYGECEYRATDPSECLQKKYAEIIKSLSLDSEKYRITQEGFEEANIEKNYYDLVFTSPPFFDLEKYTNEPSQSHIKYNTLEEWVINFMYPLLKKSHRALVKGGHLCLYISDNKGSKIKFVDRVKEYLGVIKNIKYVGKISWTTGKYPREIIVYKKL